MADKPIDFLLLTALPDERNAARRIFDSHADAVDLDRWRVQRLSGDGVYTVALHCFGGAGTGLAQQETRIALRKWSPRHVLLIGIAAGFPESEVALGDILVPEFVLETDFGKIKERRIPLIGRYLTPIWEYRGTPVAVDPQLYSTAKQELEADSGLALGELMVGRRSFWTCF